MWLEVLSFYFAFPIILRRDQLVSSNTLKYITKQSRLFLYILISLVSSP